MESCTHLVPHRGVADVYMYIRKLEFTWWRVLGYLRDRPLRFSSHPLQYSAFLVKLHGVVGSKTPKEVKFNFMGLEVDIVESVGDIFGTGLDDFAQVHRRT